MDFNMNLQNECPPNLAVEIRQIDVTLQDSGQIISEIVDKSFLNAHCIEAMLVTIAKKINALTDQLVLSNFFSSLATHHKILSDNAKSQIKEGILRARYMQSIAAYYFTALRYNQIDVRDYLQDKIIEDWSFTHPRAENAATWHYYLYLASLNEPGAIEALDKKIAITASGNDVTNLLTSLYDLKSEEAFDILLKYKDDMRRADAPEGEGMSISETVKIYLGLE